MKKSALLLIIAIAMIVIGFVLDAYISTNVMDFTDPASFGAGQYICIAVGGVLVITGVILIIVSRKVAKKERNAA